MTPSVLSTIAQMVYHDEAALDFARIVTEVERVLAPLCPVPVGVDWTCDDLVTFTALRMRVVLAMSDVGANDGASDGQPHGTSNVGPRERIARGPGHRAAPANPTRPARRGTCVTVSVAQTRTADADPDQAALCSRLVERIQSRFLPAAVVWHEVQGSVDADRVDALLTRLPAQNVAAVTALPPVHSILDQVLRTDDQKSATAQSRAKHAKQTQPPPSQIRQTTPAPAKSGPEPLPAARLMVAVDQPLATVTPSPAAHAPGKDGPQRNADLAVLRTALYPRVPVPPPAPSMQMRLVVHCFNATLIMVWVPLGAAVMIYTLLKGEDIVFSSRMIAVTGTVLALVTSPLGRSVRAVAGL